MSITTWPISFEGTRFICNLEGFQAFPYKDPGGDGHWVIGYGTEITDAQAKVFAEGISRNTAGALFFQHNEPLQKQLAKTPLVSLLQYQRDALFSLAYNIGINALLESTIYKHLVARDVDLSPWLWFDKSSLGQTLQNLVRRRKIELRLFQYGNYSTE